MPWMEPGISCGLLENSYNNALIAERECQKAVIELTEEHVKNKDDVQLKKAIEVLGQMTCVVQRNGY